jgi:type VI secretion system protein ImpE
MTSASDLYDQGKLGEAVAAQSAAVKAKPADVDGRGLLVELLCIAGQLERADGQLETILAQHPDRTPGCALLRQLIRAELARLDFWSVGRVPEFLSTPSERMKAALEASVRLRAGDFAGATELLVKAEEARRPLRGTHNGRPFADLRELDERFGPALEILSTTGKYFWIDFESVETLAFEAPARPIDLLWRRATLDVRDGPQGVVYVPAVYAPMDGASDAQRLARATDWSETGAGGPVRGFGQRVWMQDEVDVPLLEFGRLEFAGAGS